MYPNPSSTVRYHHPPVQAQPPVYWQTPVVPAVRMASTPPALYVVGSFLLMMVLAAFLSVFGSVGMLALIDGMDDQTPAADVPAPAASIR
jgi:hypothetical protein